MYVGDLNKKFKKLNLLFFNNTSILKLKRRFRRMRLSIHNISVTYIEMNTFRLACRVKNILDQTKLVCINCILDKD